jgi:hypothetical protein
VRLSILSPDGAVAAAPARAAVLATVMTGDMECAVTGKGFDALLERPDPQLVQPMLRRGAVFARMSPDNKRDLMHLLGNGLEAAPDAAPLGLHVGFCGDGANDCGALKAAHVGVSLCEAEASVAAPMTSRHQSVASMVTVVSEGRCALLATYQIFQFVVGYAMAQAFSVNLMYTYALQMGNYMFLIQVGAAAACRLASRLATRSLRPARVAAWRGAAVGALPLSGPDPGPQWGAGDGGAATCATRERGWRPGAAGAGAAGDVPSRLLQKRIETKKQIEIETEI